MSLVRNLLQLLSQSLSISLKSKVSLLSACVCTRKSPTRGVERVVVFGLCESLRPADAPRWLWEGKASVLGDICCTRCRNHRQSGGWVLAGSCARIYWCSQTPPNHPPPSVVPHWPESVHLHVEPDTLVLTVATQQGQDIRFKGSDFVYFKFFLKNIPVKWLIRSFQNKTFPLLQQFMRVRISPVIR